MLNTLEILFWKCARRIIIKGYGCDCEGSDLDEFPEMYQTPKDTFASGRCASCRAKEIVLWIESHIELIKHFR